MVDELSKMPKPRFPFASLIIAVLLLGGIVYGGLYLVGEDRNIGYRDRMDAISEAQKALCTLNSCREKVQLHGERCFEENYRRVEGSKWYKILDRRGFHKCLRKQI